MVKNFYCLLPKTNGYSTIIKKDNINPGLRQSFKFKGDSTIMRKINSIERGLYEAIDHMSFPAMEWLICRMVLNGLIPIEKVLSAAGYSESEARTIINRWNEGAEPGIGSWIERLSRIPRNEVLMYLTKQK